jgi:hypothetical protein
MLFYQEVVRTLASRQYELHPMQRDSEPNYCQVVTSTANANMSLYEQAYELRPRLAQ